MTSRLVFLTLLPSDAWSLICLCRFSEKNMKADLNLFGASGAFLYLVTLPFLFGMMMMVSLWGWWRCGDVFEVSVQGGDGATFITCWSWRWGLHRHPLFSIMFSGFPFKPIKSHYHGFYLLTCLQRRNGRCHMRRRQKRSQENNFWVGVHIFPHKMNTNTLQQYPFYLSRWASTTSWRVSVENTLD